MFFFQSLDEKNKKHKLVAWKLGATIGVSSSACGLSAHVLLKGACLQSHGGCPRLPMP